MFGRFNKIKALNDLVNNLCGEVDDIKGYLSGKLQLQLDDPKKTEKIVKEVIAHLLQNRSLVVATKYQEKVYYTELIASEVEELKQKEKELKEALDSVNEALKKVKSKK